MSSKHLSTLNLAGRTLPRALLLPVGYSGLTVVLSLVLVNLFLTVLHTTTPLFPGIPSLKNTLEKQMNLKFKGLPWKVKV